MDNLPVDLLNYISKYSYLILIFVFLQGSLVFVLLVLFIERVLSSRSRRRDDELIKQEAFEEATRMLEGARGESLRIIEESQKKATEMLSVYLAFDQKFKQALEAKVNSIYESHLQNMKLISDGYIKSYKQYFDMVKEAGAAEIEKNSNNVKEGLLSEVISLKDILKQETLGIEKEVRGKIQAEYDEVRGEIEDYKIKELNRVDASIFKILSGVSKNTIGTILDLDTQQGVVIHLLDEAKKENKLIL